MRRNVLAWLVEQVPNARHAVILTHNIDFLFVQNVLWSALRHAGHPKITIFADAMCAAQSFDASRDLIDGLGVRYRVVPVDMGPGRRFHPKALFIAGPDRAALAVGSGNLTHGGMSANKEAWSFAVSGGDGERMIAAFRHYALELARGLPLAEPLLSAIEDAFDPVQEWAVALPDPGGLARTPSDTPLIEQIAKMAPGPFQKITVLAPYHDPDGAALTAIAERFGAPVTCWMQYGHVGLSRATARSLPPEIRLAGVECADAQHKRFIHAKVLVLHREEEAVLVVGSANCSRAALLADRSWGNAELVAVDVVRGPVVDEFLADIEPCTLPLEMPEDPPGDDWEATEVYPLRILAARYSGGRLEVAYRATTSVHDIKAVTRDGSWQAESDDFERKVASFNVPQHPRFLRLLARTPEEKDLETPEFWVDDEASLSAPATARRVLRQFQDSRGSLDADPEQAYRSVLELFRDYLTDTQAAGRRILRHDGRIKPSVAYDPNAVFAEGFGIAHTHTSRHGAFHEHGGVLAIIAALFGISPDSTIVEHPQQGEIHAQDDDGTEEPIGSDDDQGGVEPVRSFDDADLEKELALPPSRRPADRVAAQLRTTLNRLTQALASPSFVSSRHPSVLGADIALAAVLLTLGVSEGHLDVPTFREVTRNLWRELIFGTDGGATGMLPERVRAMRDAGEREAFIADLASARLGAALALWAAPEWHAADPEGAWFRLSAARLHELCPWLLGPVAPDIMKDEVAAMAATLLKPNDRLAAVQAWGGMIQGGEALKAVGQALTGKSPDQLSGLVTSSVVKPTDLVWAKGQFAFPLGNYKMLPKEKADLLFLGETKPHRYMAARLLPVRDLVAAPALSIPQTVADVILRLAKDAGAMQPPLGE